MNIETVAIDTLSPDPANARKHGEKNLKAIIDSLRAFGQQKPIVVDARGVVIAGNGTMEAARSLGWTEIQIVRSDLTPAEAIAFGIADNRTGELASWDYEILQSLVEGLDGEDALKAIGFDDTDLASIMGVDFDSSSLLGNDGYEANADRHTVHFHGDAWPRIRAVLDRASDLPDGDADALVAIAERWAASLGEAG